MSGDIDIEALSNFARVAYGEKWVAPFAADLSVEAKRKVAPTQIHQWTSGARPVPSWVDDALVPVLRRRAYTLQRQARNVWQMAADIERLLAPPLPPEPALDAEPELDDGPAPQM